MDGKRLIHRLRLENFLTYGHDGVNVELQSLNVLIGPNASGKSNFLEAFEVIRAMPRDLAAAFRRGGGITEYLWRGADFFEDVVIQTTVDVSYIGPPRLIHHSMKLFTFNNLAHVSSEVIYGDEFNETSTSEVKAKKALFYGEWKGSRVINARVDGGNSPKRSFRDLAKNELRSDQSILTQRRDPDQYPEITSIASRFEDIVVFRDSSFTQAATVGQTDLPSDFLLPSGSNLGLVLNELMLRSETRNQIVFYLQKLYHSARFILTRVQGGTIQTYVEEDFREPIPATRLSSGTLRYLCLLAILCHPSPPPLICLEEPELGLHPDILPTIAELLVQASQRTQLIVTTHSDALISALSPESVLVCERDQDGSHLRRLDPERLRKWLDEYSLGDLWRMGELGGTRW